MVSDAMNMTVRQMLQQHPESEAVLRLLNIAPDVAVPLAHIADRRRWPADILPVVLASVRAGEDDGSPSARVELRLRRSVVVYVRDRYHQPLRAELERIESLLDDAIASCAASLHDRIGRIRDVFMRLSKQLRVHVGIEEDLLFPSLHDDGQAGARTGAGEMSIAERALQEMDEEHDILDSCLRDISELTHGHTPASDDGEQVSVLYDELRMFELRLRQHAAVEHDFLWPTTAHTGAAIETERTQVPDTDADVEERMCPRTQRPCEEGHPINCGKFWDCLQNVISARWREASEDVEHPS